MTLLIIDRYVLRQFVRAFLICFVSLSGLYVTLDAFGHLDEFMRFAEKEGNVLGVIFDYYSYQTLAFFEMLSGVMALFAAMVTVAAIQRHNELTALLAAGISRARVVRPVLVAAASIGLLAAATRELVIPHFRDQLSRTPKDLGGEMAHKLTPRYDNQTDILLGGQFTYANEQRIERPNFLLPSDRQRWARQIVGENAYYSPADGDWPAGYLIDQVSQPGDIAEKPSLVIDNRRVVITPTDAPDKLKPNQCFVASEVDYEQLTGGQTWKRYSSTPDLVRGLRNPSLDFGADVRVAIHSRVAQPMLDVTLLFLGLPLMLSRNNRNVFVSVGVCLALVSVFTLFVFGARSLGTIYLISPALAAWLPLIVFVPIAAAMYDKARHW